MAGLWARIKRIFGMRPKLPLGDVTVIGLVHSTHVIEDLGRDVPYGMTVTIPGELAVNSKDLWAGISQQCLLRLPAGAPALQLSLPPSLPQGPKSSSDAGAKQSALEAQVKVLVDQLQTAKRENEALREALASSNQAQTAKLDTILAAIQNGAIASIAGAKISYTPKEEVADGSAPAFLPSQIKPTDVDARIEIQSEASESNVSSAAERLRRLKKGG